VAPPERAEWRLGRGQWRRGNASRGGTCAAQHRPGPRPLRVRGVAKASVQLFADKLLPRLHAYPPEPALD